MNDGQTPQSRADSLQDECPRCGKEQMFANKHWHRYTLCPGVPCYGCGLCGCVVYTLHLVSTERAA